jgi:hypothetical protein
VVGALRRDLQIAGKKKDTMLVIRRVRWGSEQETPVSLSSVVRLLFSIVLVRSEVVVRVVVSGPR